MSISWGTEDGAFKCRTVRRMAPSARWDLEAINKMRGEPWKWKPTEGEVEADPPKAPEIPVETGTEGGPEAPRERKKRRCEIRRTDVWN